MKQNISLAVLISGIGSFFWFGSEILARHTSWVEFQTPAGVGEIFGLFFSVIAAVGAALGVDLGLLRKLINGGKGVVSSREDNHK